MRSFLFLFTILRQVVDAYNASIHGGKREEGVRPVKKHQINIGVRSNEADAEPDDRTYLTRPNSQT